MSVSLASPVRVSGPVILLRRLAGWIGARAQSERLRWPLWLPVGMGAGIAFYFLLPTEPAWWVGPVLVAVALLLWGFGQRTDLRAPAALALMAALGFGAACWQTASLEAPQLQRRLGSVMVEGRVVEAPVATNGRRVLIDLVRLDGVAPADTPARVRVTIRPALLPREGIEPGASIRVRAGLMPPPPAATPDGTDFRRTLFFQRIGAVGWALAAPELGPAPLELPAEIRIARLRAAMTERILAALPGETGALAAALIAGDRGALSEPLNQAMRDSGLAHILSISGLHIGVVAGAVLLVLRAGFALSPWLTLRLPVRKIATAAALVVALAYCILAGWSAPTQRSLFMGALALAAVLLDRFAITARTLAAAAVLVLIADPEALVGPSFQMSFAAVAALVAGAERWSGGIAAWRREAGPGGKIALWLVVLAATSLLATLGTAPFSAAHFQRVALYGLVANLLAVPLSSIALPLGLVAVVLMPFGWEAVALVPMGWTLDATIWIARWTADLPGAVIITPPVPAGALVFASLAVVWTCLWQGRWRWLGAVPMLLAILWTWGARQPDILIADNGRGVAIRQSDGTLVILPGTDRLVAQIWRGRSPDSRTIDIATRDDATPRCDRLGCRHRLHGLTIAVTVDARALPADCREADVVIALVPTRGRCRDRLVLIDRFDLWRNGAHALWLTPDPKVTSHRGRNGTRPWNPEPRPRPRPTAEIGDEVEEG
ncbi:MAG: ComEC/Rec2 family competence protein [Alphaproteobacteria bacterium]|nr:ComEC/Rec2 family competence protein [Alphaproteobacteria bacterium]